MESGKLDMNLEKALSEYDFILTEAAVIETLKREAEIALHPELVNALLIYDEGGRRLIAKLINNFIALARNVDVPITITTPTWRANRERLAAVGEARNVNADAVAFINEIKTSWGAWQEKIIVGGLMSCKHDCYLPEEGLISAEAEVFHVWQSRRLSAAGVDFLLAQTLPALSEAVGMARAMAATSTPYIISFVINREGRLLDGHSLAEAIAAIDAALEKPPLGYMVNCAYPSFLQAEREPDAVISRLIGFQANASSLDHAQLNEAEKMEVDEVSDWGRRMVILNRNFGLPILGGCCGTGVEHLNYLTKHLAG
ncbi:MAG: homocysteine S-methyltransferase family protein [Pseudomonadota bacterium]|nr:homocysteine S-methyltransferase family protein [Pseudomonadota bacterium]